MSSTPPTSRAGLSSGDVVAGRYHLEHVLGEGGVGIVWAATQITTGRQVALKVLKRTEKDDTARFLREARVGASLQHRNIVQVFDLWQVPEDDCLIMVMERLHGESLAQRLRRERALPWMNAIDIMLAVSAALSCAHERGFIHRDLKPENIFLSRESDNEVIVKVLDFGLARPLDRSMSDGVTQTGSILGTPHYMAPEQVFGETSLSSAVDSWAFGVTLAECLTGKRVFDGENVGQIFKVITQGPRPDFGALFPPVPELQELVSKLLVRDPSARPSDREIQQVLTKLQTPANRSSGAFALANTTLPLTSLPPHAATLPAREASRTMHLANTSNTLSEEAPDGRSRANVWWAAGGLAAITSVLLWLSLRSPSPTVFPNAISSAPTILVVGSSVAAPFESVQPVSTNGLAPAASATLAPASSATDNVLPVGTRPSPTTVEAPAPAEKRGTNEVRVRTPKTPGGTKRPSTPLDSRF